LEELSSHFQLPEKAVAKKLGVCLTSLKKLCRQHGIHRWPYRKLKSIEKKLEKLVIQMRSPAEDLNGVRAKIHALNEEKKRLPFSGTPSCAYGGVRRTSLQSSPSSVYDSLASSMPSMASGHWQSASQSPRSVESTSPEGMSFGSAVSSGPSRLAQRLKAVGSVSDHKMRLAANMGVVMPGESLGAQPCYNAAEYSDASYSSGEDFSEQPDDDMEDCLMYGTLPGPMMFDVPVPVQSSASPVFSMDASSMGCSEGVHAGLGDDLFSDALVGGDDFFSSAF
jgi:hypothetical protein